MSAHSFQDDKDALMDVLPTDMPSKPEDEESYLPGRKVDESGVGINDDIEPTRALDQHRSESPWAAVTGWRKVLVFLGLYLGLFLATLDTSIVATALVTILTEFNSFALSPWIVLTYLVAYMSFAIAFARLSDIYGRKTMMLAAWIIFTTFSIACAVSRDIIELIIFRGLQGIGGSGLFSLTMVIIQEASPVHMIALTSGLIGITLGCSGILGPILGGLISHLTTWRWIFYMNIPIGVIAIATILIAWPNMKGHSLSSKSAFLSIDFLGILLLLGANCLHIYGFETAGSMAKQWSSPSIVACLVTFACCWIAFIAWELYLASREEGNLQPLFPFRLVIKQRVMAAVMVSTFLTGFPFIVVVITLPERFQIVNGASSLMAGIYLLPLLGSSAIGSFLGGAINSKHNFTSYTLFVSSILQVIGVGLLSTLGETVSMPRRQYAFEAILGFGIGASLSTTTIMTSVKAKPKELAAAQGAIAQIRILGGILGLTIATTLFNRRSTAALAGKLSPEQLSALYRSPLAALAFPEDEQLLVKKTYSSFFALQMRVLMYICCVGVVVAACSWERRPPNIRMNMGAHSRGVQSDADERGIAGESERHDA